MTQTARAYSRGGGISATRGNTALAPLTRPNQRPLGDILPEIEFKKYEGNAQAKAPEVNIGIMNALKVAIVIAVIIACAALFRIWLTTEIVQTQTQINTVKSQVADVRAYGSELEIQYNSMTDPAILEKVARDDLKMETPKTVNHIELQ